MKKGTAQEPKSQALATTAPAAEEPKALNTVAEYAAADFESNQYQDDFRKDDFAIPFLQVLQSNSPQVKKNTPDYLSGAEPGMFINTTSKKLYSMTEGVVLIPVHYHKTFIEWRLRTEGGGFVKDHGLEAGLKLLGRCTKNTDGKIITPDSGGKNQLVETAQYIVVIVDDDPVPAFFSLTSTQLKKSRLWNSAIDAMRVPHNGKRVKPPMFYFTYTVTSVFEKNDKGDWFGVTITPAAAVSEIDRGEEYYQTARQLRDSVQQGLVTTEKSANANPDASADSAADAEVPF